MIDIDNISDEMLAAYIDGNLSQDEMIQISETVNTESSLSEVVDIISGTERMIDNPFLYGDDMSNNTDFWAKIPEDCNSFSPESISIIDIADNDFISDPLHDGLTDDLLSSETDNSLDQDFFDNSNPTFDI